MRVASTETSFAIKTVPIEPMSRGWATISLRSVWGTRERIPHLKTEAMAAVSKELNAVAESRGAQEALLLRGDGRVTEAGWGNIAGVTARRELLIVADGALPGIAQKVLQQRIAPYLGLSFQQWQPTLQELLSFDGLVLYSNSVRGLLEVIKIDDGARTASPLFDDLYDLYWSEKIWERV